MQSRRFATFQYTEGGNIAISADGKGDGAGVGYDSAPPTGAGAECPNGYTGAVSAISAAIGDSCSSAAAAGMCNFTSIASKCPSSCGQGGGASDAWDASTAELAADYWASTYLVLPIRTGHTLEVLLDPNVTMIFASLGTDSKYSLVGADAFSPCERALWSIPPGAPPQQPPSPSPPPCTPL